MTVTDLFNAWDDALCAFGCHGRACELAALIVEAESNGDTADVTEFRAEHFGRWTQNPRNNVRALTRRPARPTAAVLADAKRRIDGWASEDAKCESLN